MLKLTLWQEDIEAQAKVVEHRKFRISGHEKLEAVTLPLILQSLLHSKGNFLKEEKIR